jgi:hypothetical protein
MSKCAQAALARKLSLVEKYSRKLKTLKSKEARRKAANRMKKFSWQAAAMTTELAS